MRRQSVDLIFVLMQDFLILIRFLNQVEVALRVPIYLYMVLPLLNDLTI